MMEYELEKASFKEIKDNEYGLAVLPWGATEAHNYHLPYGTDNYETIAIGRESVGMANENGANALLLPCIPFGVNTGQTDIPFTINMNPSTQALVLRDVITSIQNSGTYKFLILNGHGGNDFKQMLRELGNEFPEMMLASCNWFQSVDKNSMFDNEGDHADEMETSLMMHLHSDLVLPLHEAGSGKSKKFSVKALNESWAWAERKWTKVSEDTGIGDPSKATKEKGEQYFNQVCEKISGLILELDKVNRNNFYE
jgi:creatinine amidohydrolase